MLHIENMVLVQNLALKFLLETRSNNALDFKSNVLFLILRNVVNKINLLRMPSKIQNSLYLIS